MSTTPNDVIRDTLDVLTAECNYIGALPPAATQSWADEIVRQLNEWSMLSEVELPSAEDNPPHPYHTNRERRLLGFPETQENG